MTRNENRDNNKTSNVRYCRNPVCRTPFIPITNKTKFCSRKCQVRYNSLRKYNAVKDTEEYKQYRRNYFNEWRKKNKEHFV